MAAFTQKSVLTVINNHGRDHLPWQNKMQHYSDFHDSWLDFVGFAIGTTCGPEVVAVKATADSTLDLSLRTAVPDDSVSIKVALDDAVNLAGFGRSPASGTVLSQASSEVQITLGHGLLSGTYSALLSIAVTASIPAAHATVQMQITESFQLSLSGKGFAGTSFTHADSSSGTVVAPPPAVSPQVASFGKSADTFDLAGFAASILNTGHWDIAFTGLAPGESLQVSGSSTLTIDAAAQLAGHSQPERLSLHETDHAHFVVNEKSGPAAGGLFGMQPYETSLFGSFHSTSG